MPQAAIRWRRPSPHEPLSYGALGRRACSISTSDPVPPMHVVTRRQRQSLSHLAWRCLASLLQPQKIDGLPWNAAADQLQAVEGAAGAQQRLQDQDPSITTSQNEVSQ